MSEKLAVLYTPFEKEGPDWSAYPRPQMKRESFISLSGKWRLSSLYRDKREYLGEIEVPFPPESRLSGVERTKQAGEMYIYEKTFSLPVLAEREKLVLHFGAVDCHCKVFVNGKKAGEHTGGYLPFTFDITELACTGENVVSVTVTDELDTELAYGKQRKKRGGMWYTPVSGIWQTVWLEAVPFDYIRSLRITPTLSSVTIETEGGAEEKCLTVKTEKGEITYTYRGNSFTLDMECPRLWSPEDPYLYYFTLTSGDDRIESYFALRTVKAENGYILLNDRPYFFHGLLDQGYYPDGIYTPATPEGYEWDILTMKSLGFNMLRKHIKVEPELFYHYCDKHGMIVFQDMVNSGKYSFLIDTALPTAGIKRGITHKATKVRREHFEKSARETVALLYNHPSVCYYTIFNEGWGQYDADRIYGEMKREDPSRVWDATSGWFFEKDSDVKSEHVYFKKLNMKRDARPLVLSEFGGYSLRIPDHVFNLSGNYGYKSFSSKEELSKGLRELYLGQVVPEIEKKGLCAAVLTQVSDVEDETNGMVTYDRQVVKVDRDSMKEISEELRKAFEKQL
ncbi:MAG: glycoside hydrolase family 2 [Clostridia bacterium]|nr:glycoside hydrolase family 2 [Clostridia bacterium]